MKKNLGLLLVCLMVGLAGCEVRPQATTGVCKDTTCTPGSECQPNPDVPTSPICVPTQECDEGSDCDTGEVCNGQGRCITDPATGCAADEVAACAPRECEINGNGQFQCVDFPTNCTAAEVAACGTRECKVNDQTGDFFCVTPEECTPAEVANCAPLECAVATNGNAFCVAAPCDNDGTCDANERSDSCDDCVSGCQSNDDCPTNHLCDVQHQCIPPANNGDDCVNDADCNANAFCDDNNNCILDCNDATNPCPSGQICSGSSGRCQAGVATCGNGIPDVSETKSNCPADCPANGTKCDGICQSTENAGSVPADCAQANGYGADPVIPLPDSPTCHNGVGLAHVYSGNNHSGIVQFFFPTFQERTVTDSDNDGYLELCGLIPGQTYRLTWMDSFRSFAYYGTPDHKALIDPNGPLCFLFFNECNPNEVDQTPTFSIRFTMGTNGVAVAAGTECNASGNQCAGTGSGTGTGTCGDNSCNNNETVTSCFQDCGSCDNDNVCEPAQGESTLNCPNTNDCPNTTGRQYPAPVIGQTVSGHARCVGYAVEYLPNNTTVKQREQYSPSFLVENIADQNANSVRVEKCELNVNQIYEETFKNASGVYADYGFQSVFALISDANKQVIFKDSAGNLKLRYKIDGNGAFIPCGNKGIQGGSLPSGCN